MCMIYDENRILVQDRVDPEWPGLTFPGGHVEANESFVDSVIREVKEETGLDIDNVRLCGLKQWTHKDGSFRYIVFFFKTNSHSGVLRSSGEGDVFWIDKSELDSYVLADGFREMLEIFDNDKLSENYFWFSDNEWKCKNN